MICDKLLLDSHRSGQLSWGKVINRMVLAERYNLQKTIARLLEEMMGSTKSVLSEAGTEQLSSKTLAALAQRLISNYNI